MNFPIVSSWDGLLSGVVTDVSTSLVEPDYGPRTTADYGLRSGCKIDAGCKSNLKTHCKKSSYEKRLESKLRKVRVFWCDWPICEITHTAREYKKNTKEGEEEKICYFKFRKTKEIFYSTSVKIICTEISETARETVHAVVDCPLYYLYWNIR